MSTTYKHIQPKDVYTTMIPNKPSLDDAGQEIVLNKWGNLPSGNDFIDLYAGLIRKYGNRTVGFYAQEMGVPLRLMSNTILAMTGLSARTWIHEYVILGVCELVKETDMQFNHIGKRLGLSPVSFSRFVQLMRKCQPNELRYGYER